MKRRVLLICFAVSLLVATVFAHPGGTDGSGGHRNHSTGDYHYHHGYSAHDHYDMDGDGILDCPYDFDDKTDHSNSGSNGIASGTDTSTKPVTQKTTSKSKQISLSKIISEIFEVLLGAIAIWIFSLCFLTHICFALFGEDRGCSVSVVLSAVIAVSVSIWLIIERLS